MTRSFQIQLSTNVMTMSPGTMDTAVEREDHVAVEGESAELQLGTRLGREVNPQLGEEAGPSEEIGTSLCHLPMSRMGRR